MLGLHRQFVFAPESCARLPELALLMANILTYLVTVLPPMPTGFWDRHPKNIWPSASGLIGRVFPKDALSDPQLRKKTSVTTHLPKGRGGSSAAKAPT